MFKVTVRAVEKVNYFIRIIICDKLYRLCVHIFTILSELLFQHLVGMIDFRL